MKVKRILLPVVLVLGGLAFAAGMALVFGLIVMALWNWLMPEIFGLPTIAYWQAWGLVLLAHILFKSGRGDHSGGRSRKDRGKDKWEEKLKSRFRQKFSDHEHGPKGWSNHGPYEAPEDAPHGDEDDSADDGNADGNPNDVI